MNRQGFLAAALAACCVVPGHSPRANEPPGIIPGEFVDSETMLETGGDLGSPALDFQEEQDTILVSPDAASYQFYITDLESRFGPYATELSEQLLGLGRVYQEQNLHSQAIDIFKRAVHIVRINGGLYAPEQIPLLQREIRSLMAVGDFESADERQFYLYRVQANVYGLQSEQMSLAMLERAEWEREAYYLSVGETSFLRLLTMWELYSNVLRNIARQEGKLSEGLLRPLQGLLQTQYLISSYAPGSPAGFQSGGPDEHSAEQARFGMVRVSNYKQGQAVITAMREVYGYNEGEGSPLPAEALIKLGDWHLWHQKRESALAAYQQAWDELSALEDGERLLEEHFSQPVLLPDVPGAHQDLTEPEIVRGYANVSYDITAKGRVKNLVLENTEASGSVALAAADDEQAGAVEEEPGDAADGETTAAASENDSETPVQLMRRVKRLLYRPRFENREPVAVEDVRRRYAY